VNGVFVCSGMIAVEWHTAGLLRCSLNSLVVNGAKLNRNTTRFALLWCYDTA